MKDFNAEKLAIAVNKILEEADFWFKWRGAFGKIKLTKLQDITSEIRTWSQYNKLVVSWRKDESGYNIIVSVVKEEENPAQILGGIVCEDQKRFEAVFDMLHSAFDFVARSNATGPRERH